MSESTQDRLSKIRDYVKELTMISSFQFPAPVTDEDRESLRAQLEMLDTARSAWLLANPFSSRLERNHLSTIGLLNMELAEVVRVFTATFHYQLPPRGKNPEMDALLDRAEEALRWALIELKP
jgi:hypothetical protein